MDLYEWFNLFKAKFYENYFNPDCEFKSVVDKIFENMLTDELTIIFKFTDDFTTPYFYCEVVKRTSYAQPRETILHYLDTGFIVR
uniref:Transposase n=1 Tax=Rhabditophanes sp. KR3021 TaxID=114890 RepID=A0AC35U4U3_9BILA